MSTAPIDLSGENLTEGSFFNGRLQVVQPRSGYRFSIDAVLLAHLAIVRRDDVVLELGTGCGIVTLMMAYRRRNLRLYGVEIQPELAEVARHNVTANGMQARIGILNMDMRLLSRDSISERIDMVVANPPYHQPGAGRRCTDRQRAIAREEITVTLDQVLLTARGVLFKTGRMAVIYPAQRTVDLLARMRHFNLEPKTIRMIHARVQGRAELILVEAVKAARPGLFVEPPLTIYNPAGGYSQEVGAMLKG